VASHPDVTHEKTTFVEYLKSANITRPDEDVLVTLSKRYSQNLQAALSIGLPGPCVDLYETVKVLPKSFTRGVIQNDLQVSINGPMSLAQPNILTAVDLVACKNLLIKLLRIPETNHSVLHDARKNAVLAEIEACRLVSEAHVEGLVQSEIVEVTVHHSDQLNVGPGLWAAIKMRHYVSSLAERPQLSEEWIYRGFRRIQSALNAMHALSLVHMDVKSDNVFVDESVRWDLGDFGSTRKIGESIWSFTEVLNPYKMPGSITVIPSMDMVLLCIMVAVEINKIDWKERLCGRSQRVQQHLILECLQSIEDTVMKLETIALFTNHLQLVEQHIAARKVITNGLDAE
jgi:hypothetical protein